MRTRIFWIIVGILIATAFGILLIFLGAFNKKENTLIPSPSPNQSKTSNVEESNPPEREITVQAYEYSFSPSLITINKGEKIILTLRNTGAMSHNLVIEGLPVATKTIGTGQSDKVEFTVNETGTFLFYCSIGTHRELGMEGTLEVK